jgi:hypothetical protein
MYELVVILKALVEVAAVGMFGQGILYVVAGRGREQNLVYQLFKTITSPVTRLVRAITPRVVLDRHIWLVSTLLLGMLWLALAVYKIELVRQGASAA